MLSPRDFDIGYVLQSSLLFEKEVSKVDLSGCVQMEVVIPHYIL